MSRSHSLDTHAYRSSPVHRLPAWLKLALALIFVVAVAVVPHAAWAGVLLVPVALVARVPPSTFLVRLAIVQPFVLGVALGALFQEHGLERFLAIAGKSTASVAALQLLVHTTPFGEILDVLRKIRVPKMLLVVLALLHRYLFVVVEESRRMKRARHARSWDKTRLSLWQRLSTVLAVSFVRSIARAERIAIAMKARGGP